MEFQKQSATARHYRQSVIFPSMRRYLYAGIPALCGTAVTLWFFNLAQDRIIWQSWSHLIPFGVWPVFSDLWITLQHLREAETGADLLGDPKSAFAYPRAVLALRYLGLHHFPAAWLGLLQGTVFSFAVMLVLRPFTPRRAAGTAAFLLSPAIILGFERGNLDLSLFALCAGAAWLWSRCEGSGRSKLAVFALIGAAVLKLYPVFGLLGGAIAESSRRRFYWIAGLSTVGIYFYTIRSDLSFVRQKVPIMTTSSWGSLVSFVPLEAYLDRQYPATWLASIDGGLLALMTYGVVFCAAVLAGNHVAGSFANLRWRPEEWCYYWVGAGICCGCFAAANFAYRWAFALLTLPLLLRAAHASGALLVSWARITIAAMFIGFIAKFSLSPALFAAVQFANWVCISGLVLGGSALYFARPRVDKLAVEVADSTETEARAVPAGASRT